MRHRSVLYLVLVVVLFIVAACGGGGTEEQPTAEVQDTGNATAEPTTVEVETPPNNPVSFYLLTEGDVENGIVFGCGDVAAPVASTVAATGNLRDDIREALIALAAATNDSVEGFTSSLDGLGLRVLSVTVNGGSSVTISIMGNVRFGEDRCLGASMEALIVFTIMQFDDIDSTQVTLAGRNMRQVFSTRSDLSLVSAYTREDYLDIINENSGVGAADSTGDEEVDAAMEATVEATEDATEAMDEADMEAATEPTPDDPTDGDM